MEPRESVAIVVNGKPHEVSVGLPLESLLSDLGLDRRFLVVEYNGQALTAHERGTVRLAKGDRLELVRPVAGG